MITEGKATYTVNNTSVNARFQVDSAGKPSATGGYVGGVMKTMAGYVGTATVYTSDLNGVKYRLIAYFTRGTVAGSPAVFQQTYWMAEAYLTQTAPKTLTEAQKQAVSEQNTLAAQKGATPDGSGPGGANKPYGIPAPFGTGFDLPDWLKGFPGLLLLAGTVYVATRKKKN